MGPAARLRAFREHVIPLDSAPLCDRTAPEGPRTSPPALARSLADASLVGLGEATHGTRECFEHKDRLIRSLVTECGVRTVAFEVDAAAATVLDAFVRDGSALSTASADAAAALAELDMWQWRTESVRDLLEWLEAFNTGRALSAQVRNAPSVDHA
ncbi:erythromycin esterase [Halolamina pelagica]|uniref:Erythromycin esterase n=1 Tax=Halolamina pelagica TaxID=699431 RepID=A0A0P7HCG6_9EURY|nr:erythromycin esterase family protein [Halolamina pelagica]KPN31218.1 erythromycin esterase [Halolamina pelagica]